MKREWKGWVLCLALCVGGCTSSGSFSPVSSKKMAEHLVQDSLITFKRFLKNPILRPSLLKSLKKAHALYIVPHHVSESLVMGVSGGRGVLLAKAKDGRWSYPAFYDLSSVSLGAQIGLESAPFLGFILTGQDLSALMERHFYFGGQASFAMGSTGSGRYSATTAHLGEGLRGYTLPSGVFVGIALMWVSLVPDTALNKAYYGSFTTPKGIVIKGLYGHPQADALRSALRVP